MRNKHYTCGHCVLAFCCISASHCILSVVFMALFLLDLSALSHPYKQLVHSVAPVARVSPLATVSDLLITCAAWRYFTVCSAECLVAGLFGIVFPFPLIPLYIFVVGDCYSLACLQSSRLIFI